MCNIQFSTQIKKRLCAPCSDSIHIYILCHIPTQSNFVNFVFVISNYSQGELFRIFNVSTTRVCPQVVLFCFPSESLLKSVTVTNLIMFACDKFFCLYFRTLFVDLTQKHKHSYRWQCWVMPQLNVTRDKDHDNPSQFLCWHGSILLLLFADYGCHSIRKDSTSNQKTWRLGGPATKLQRISKSPMRLTLLERFVWYRQWHRQHVGLKCCLHASRNKSQQSAACSCYCIWRTCVHIITYMQTWIKHRSDFVSVWQLETFFKFVIMTCDAQKNVKHKLWALFKVHVVQTLDV